MHLKLSEYIIEKLGTVDFSTVLVCFIIIFYIANWIIKRSDHFSKIANMLYEKRKKREDLYQMILDTQSKTEEYYKNRIHDRAQSFEIQKQLTNAIQEISDKLDKIQKDTEQRFLDNQRQLQEAKEKNDKRVRAEMKDKISRAYRYYHSKKCWNYMEKEALLDLIEEYESAGGENSFVHSVVVPEMCLWEEITEFEGDSNEK